MATTITPVVHGGSRGKWAVSIALHSLGAAIAAGATGALLGLVGAAARAPWGTAGLVAVAGVGTLYAAREGLRLPIPVPALHRQVPESWRRRFRPPVASFLYGLGVGVGMATFLSFGTYVAVAVGALVSGDPLTGAVLMAPFGLARGVAVAVAHGSTTEARSRALSDRLDALAVSPLPRRANAAALLAVAAAAAFAASGGSRTGAGVALAALVAVTFAWAAFSKAARWQAWREALDGYALPAAVRRAVEVLVPAAEAAVVIAFLAGRPAIGGVFAAGLLAAFSAAIVRARARRGDQLPCGCFGSSRRRSALAMLARNAGLGFAGLAAAWWAPARPLTDGVPLPRGGELIAVALLLGGALVAIVAAVRVRSLIRS